MPSDPKTVGEAVTRVRMALDGTDYTRGFIQDVRLLTKDEAWEEYIDTADGQRKRAKDFAEFCEKALRHHPSTLADRCRKVPSLKARIEELATRPAGRPPKEGAPVILDNIKNNRPPSGTDPSRLVRELLKAGRQDLIDRIEDPDDKLSANRAAIMAGLRHPYVSVRADDPREAIKTLLRQYSAEDLLAALTEERELVDV